MQVSIKIEFPGSAMTNQALETEEAISKWTFAGAIPL